MEKLYTVSKNKIGSWLRLRSWTPYYKFRLKLKKVGKTTRPCRYDLNQIPYDYTVEEKGTTKDEMACWHHGLDRHESQWTLGVGDEQGGLACCGSWDCKESDMTEPLNWRKQCFQAHPTKPYSFMPLVLQISPSMTDIFGCFSRGREQSMRPEVRPERCSGFRETSPRCWQPG